MICPLLPVAGRTNQVDLHKATVVGSRGSGIQFEGNTGDVTLRDITVAFTAHLGFTCNLQISDSGLYGLKLTATEDSRLRNLVLDRLQIKQHRRGSAGVFFIRTWNVKGALQKH